MLHRMRLNYEALADGKRGDDVLQEILHDLTRGRKREVRATETRGDSEEVTMGLMTDSLIPCHRAICDRAIASTMEGYLDTADHLNARQFLIAVKKLADALELRHRPLAVPRLRDRVRPVAAATSRATRCGPSTGASPPAPARCYVKEYEAPKRLPCYLLIDTSASMTVTSREAEQVRGGGPHRRRAGVRLPGPGQPGRRGRRRRPRLPHRAEPVAGADPPVAASRSAASATTSRRRSAAGWPSWPRR